MKKIGILFMILFIISFTYAHSEEAPGTHTVENGHTADELTQLEQPQELATNYRSNKSASIWP